MRAILDWAIRHLVRHYEALDEEPAVPKLRLQKPAFKLHPTPSRR